MRSRGFCCISLTVAAVWTLLCVSVATAEEVFINQFAVHIEGGHNVASRVARESGLVNLGQIGSLDGHYLFEARHRERRSASRSVEHHEALGDHPQVIWFEQQVAKSRKKRDFHPRDVAEQMSVIDPYWKNQWYLHHGALGGFDMNVMGAWRKGYTGKNIVVTILDDGLERDHPDLVKNYDPYASYDVNGNDHDPMPRYDASNENRHGTRCAGEVSAEANNTVCTIGIAPDSRIGGVRMLDGEVYDAVEAASLSFNRSHVDIYSASWGPDDDGKVVDGPGKLAKKAFLNGIEHGRGGKGSIFVWASGNGGSAQDSCNCDGYANSIFTLSISSTSEHGVKPWYLEECSSTLATTYSSGAYNERQIATTDLRKRCTMTHTGTSASAPLAAGIVALILEANPQLTWRDVQYITLMTSRPEPIKDGQWIVNGVGRKVSLRYGYGLMDATAMVDLALIWKTVPKKAECVVTASATNRRLAAHTKFSSKIQTNGCHGTATEVNYLEHVQARVSLTYQRRGDIILYLTSPAGTRSQILPYRPNDAKGGGFDDWPFLSVHFWGENPNGEWTLEVEDGDSFKQRAGGGTLLKWSLVFHGTKQQPVRLKNETGHASTTSTTTITTTSTITTKKPSPKPTEHPELCHPECQNGCTGTSAEDCKDCKHFRYQSSCVTQCPNGYFAMEKACVPCDPSCATCSGPTIRQCLSCPQGHLFQNTQQEGICLQDCLAGFYSNNSTCLQCHASCLKCVNSDLDCTACHKDSKLVGNTCIQQEHHPEAKHFQKVILVVVLVVLIGLVMFVVVGIIVFLRKNNYLCWGDVQKYGLLPQDDEVVTVKLNYTDDPEDEYGG